MIDSTGGNVFSTTKEIAAERIARPKTSSKTAALTRIFPSFVFSLPISSRIVTAIAILVALSAVPTITATVHSNPKKTVMKYPKTSGVITPITPTTAAFDPALIKS